MQFIAIAFVVNDFYSLGRKIAIPVMPILIRDQWLQRLLVRKRYWKNAKDRIINTLARGGTIPVLIL